MKKWLGVLAAVIVLIMITSCKASEDEHINFGTLIPVSTRSVLVEHSSCGKTVFYTAEKKALEEIEYWLSGLKCERRSFEHGYAPSDADGGESFTFNTGKGSFSYIKNGEDNCYLLVGGDWYFVKNPENPPRLEDGEAAIKNEHGGYGDEHGDKAKAVFVQDRLYISTETESTTEGRCGNMDGKITLSVPEDEVPSQNGESNFGAGYSYQISGKNTIDVFIGDKAIVFECYDDESEIWVSDVEEEEEAHLTKDDGARVKLLIAEAVWQSGAPNCLNDCLIGGFDEESIFYHSDCGTLSRQKAGKYCTLQENEKELLNDIVEQYIALGAP